MRKLILLFMFLSCFNIKNINAQNSDNNELLSFMVYGNDFLTSIALPNKWNVDMNFAQRAGVNGFFYIRNYNINTSPAVVILSLEYNQDKIFEKWIDNNINDFLEYYENFSAEIMNWNIINENGYRIIVYKLQNQTVDILQYSAYFNVGLNYFVNMYITIKNQNIHDEMVNDFKMCLENSRFTGIGVRVIE